MTRGCSPGLIAELSGHFHPVALIEAEWHDATVRIHTGQGVLTWGGYTWVGAGFVVGSDGVNLVDFEAPPEGEGMTADGGMVRVAATLASVMGEKGKPIRNKPIRLWFGATVEPGGNVLAADPVLLFTGYFDDREFKFARSGEEYSHDLLLSLGLGPPPRAQATITHSAEDQQRKHPGDTAGRHLIVAERRRVNPPVWPEP